MELEVRYWDSPSSTFRSRQTLAAVPSTSRSSVSLAESSGSHVHCAKKVQRYDECWPAPGIWCKKSHWIMNESKCTLITTTQCLLLDALKWREIIFLFISLLLNPIFSLSRGRLWLRAAFCCRTHSWCLTRRAVSLAGWRRGESSSLSSWSSLASPLTRKKVSPCQASSTRTASR